MCCFSSIFKKQEEKNRKNKRENYYLILKLNVEYFYKFLNFDFKACP